VADPNSVLIDGSFRSQLSAAEWVLQDAGTPSLKGFDTPAPLFRVAQHTPGAERVSAQE
jgi:class 3 adenylate cyclase